MVVTLGEPEKALSVVETAKKHFPNLRLLIRAYDYTDTYDLMDAGMLHIYRETLNTSIRMGSDALKFFGRRSYKTQRAARMFLHHDEKALKKLSSVRDNSKEYILTARQVIEELEQMIKSDSIDNVLRKDTGWDEESLIAEFKKS
jgi:voltage-gated potassium channel Kch